MTGHQFPTVIVGPNPLLRESLAQLLDGSSFTIAGHAPRVDDLAPDVLPADGPSLLIIDGCNEPGEATGEIARFRETCPSGRVAVLANSCSPACMARVIRSGANGYFATISTGDDFVKSLELVMNGQTVLPSEAIAAVLLREAPDGANGSSLNSYSPIEIPQQAEGVKIPNFSDRELHILRCLTEGSSNKVIARACDIAEGTVKVHVKAILRKIKVQNRTQAAIWALSHRSAVWPEEAVRDSSLAQHRLSSPAVINVKFRTGEINGAQQAEIPDRIPADFNHPNGTLRCTAESEAIG